MKLIIGLGNPGKKYETTRHNIGFLVVDRMAEKFDGTFREKSSLESLVAEFPEKGIILAKPQTFMNASGRAVKKLMKKYSAEVEDLLIIYDDADLAFGTLRAKDTGSSGGHNGMESILTLFPKQTPIPRLRIGIGRPDHTDIPLEDFVLSKFSSQETEEMEKKIEESVELILNQT